MKKHNCKKCAYWNRNSKNHFQASNITASSPIIQLDKLAEIAPEVYKYAEIIAKKFRKVFKQFMDIAVEYLWTGYTTFAANYQAVSFIFGVLLLSLLLPDISYLLHKNNELKAIKEVVHDMTDQVDRAEVACTKTAEEMCCLHCSLRDEETETKEDLRSLSTSTSRGLVATRSEPVQVEKKIGFIRRILNLNRSISKKEIIIMSIMYTDSFDSQKMTNDVS